MGMRKSDLKAIFEMVKEYGPVEVLDAIANELEGEQAAILTRAATKIDKLEDAELEKNPLADEDAEEDELDEEPLEEVE